MSELGRMLEEAAGVEGRELSLGERQAQLEKYLSLIHISEPTRP